MQNVVPVISTSLEGDLPRIRYYSVCPFSSPYFPTSVCDNDHLFDYQESSILNSHLGVEYNMVFKKS
jgi:hypothetical protein